MLSSVQSLNDAAKNVGCFTNSHIHDEDFSGFYHYPYDVRIHIHGYYIGIKQLHSIRFDLFHRNSVQRKNRIVLAEIFPHYIVPFSNLMRDIQFMTVKE